MKPAFALAAGLLAAAPVLAAQPPSQMMANVYRLTEAAAMLHICRGSDAFRALPSEKAARIEALDGRLAGVIRAIGRHYRDDSLEATYERTRERIAAEPGLRLHVKNNFEYCGERLIAPMEAYVAENQALIEGYLKGAQGNPGPGQGVPPQPGPPGRPAR